MKLVSGRDYPNTYREFVKMFPDDATCAAFLALLRWPEGFVCPACKITTTPWNESRGRLACPICRHQTSVSTGTIFDKTRTPLMTWFEAAWHVSSAKNGMSAKTLERTIGTSYQVAWMMLQRFRVAMVNIDRNQLSGDVEVDETFVGGEEHGGKRGRGTNKSIVVIAVEIRQPKGFGRVWMRHIPDASGESLLPFVHEVVAPGSVVRTDGWSGYNGLTDYGYTRDILVQSSSGDPAHVSMPGVHRVASLLKRWLLGTHQGSVLSHHLQSYLEEFTFRFNRRTSEAGALFFEDFSNRRLLRVQLLRPI
jgi:transposase-like protein